MTDNLRHWNVLGKTDPAHTKSFTRAGGFKGTATRPIWTEMRLTDLFGPCGVGWGCDEPVFTLVSAGEEILVFCTLRCWYAENDKQASLYGVGGDKVLVKQQSGLRTDDEAYKKAFTDALGNAFKHLGAGADVHMGLFDDSKYVNEMRREFADDAPARPQTAGGATTLPANTAGSPERTESDGQSSQDGPGPTAATTASHSEHPRRLDALGAYNRIKKAVNEARLPRVIDDIVKVNKTDLELIKVVSAESYEGLMQLATDRQNELRAGA